MRRSSAERSRRAVERFRTTDRRRMRVAAQATKNTRQPFRDAGQQDRCMPKDELRRLGFPSRRRCRDVSRKPTLPRLDGRGALVASEPAHHHGAGGAQLGEPFAHGGKRHARFLGDLEIEPLTMLLQALQNVGHAGFPMGLDEPPALVLRGGWQTASRTSRRTSIVLCRVRPGR